MSRPYIMPYGDPKKWASLVDEGYSLGEFSRSCIELTSEFYQEMQNLNMYEGILLLHFYFTNFPR